MALSRDRLALLRAELARNGLAVPRADALARRAQPERAPLSFAQERLFFLELYEPGTALYNDAVLVRIEGALDCARLERALAAVQARHEILRTSFVLAKDGPEQRIHPPADVRLRFRELDLADTHDAPAAVRALARADAAAPFDLEQAPLWRATLVRTGERERFLAVTMHHIVSDGASMGLLFDELSAQYAADGAAPPLAVQFGDYTAWERARHDERAAAQHLAYWQRVLGGELPDYAWPASRGAASRRGAFAPVRARLEDVARLEELARDAQVTSNHVLLAAWLALLSAASGERDVRTGIACSLRKGRELEPLIGFFVQTLVLRVVLDGDLSFRELVRHVRAAQLEAHAHADLPYDRVARALEQGAGHAGPPLLPTFFSHMRDAIRAPSFEGARSAWEFVDPGVARFELALVLHESAGELTGFVEYDLGRFASVTAERLAAAWVTLLVTAVARPELRVSELRARCAAELRGPARTTLLSFPTNLRRASGS